MARPSKCPESFRRDAVELVLASDRPIRQIAEQVAQAEQALETAAMRKLLLRQRRRRSLLRHPQIRTHHHLDHPRPGAIRLRRHAGRPPDLPDRQRRHRPTRGRDRTTGRRPGPGRNPAPARGAAGGRGTPRHPAPAARPDGCPAPTGTCPFGPASPRTVPAPSPRTTTMTTTSHEASCAKRAGNGQLRRSRLLRTRLSGWRLGTRRTWPRCPGSWFCGRHVIGLIAVSPVGRSEELSWWI